jgi:hypothetical protein
MKAMGVTTVKNAAVQAATTTQAAAVQAATTQAAAVQAATTQAAAVQDATTTVQANNQKAAVFIEMQLSADLDAYDKVVQHQFDRKGQVRIDISEKGPDNDQRRVLAEPAHIVVTVIRNGRVVDSREYFKLIGIKRDRFGQDEEFAYKHSPEYKTERLAYHRKMREEARRIQELAAEERRKVAHPNVVKSGPYAGRVINCDFRGQRMSSYEMYAILHTEEIAKMRQEGVLTEQQDKYVEQLLIRLSICNQPYVEPPHVAVAQLSNCSGKTMPHWLQLEADRYLRRYPNKRPKAIIEQSELLPEKTVIEHPSATVIEHPGQHRELFPEVTVIEHHSVTVIEHPVEQQKRRFVESSGVLCFTQPPAVKINGILPNLSPAALPPPPAGQPMFLDQLAKLPKTQSSNLNLLETPHMKRVRKQKEKAAAKPTEDCCSSVAKPTEGCCSSVAKPTEGCCSSVAKPTEGCCSSVAKPSGPPPNTKLAKPSGPPPKGTIVPKVSVQHGCSEPKVSVQYVPVPLVKLTVVPPPKKND